MSSSFQLQTNVLNVMRCPTNGKIVKCANLAVLRGPLFSPPAPIRISTRSLQDDPVKLIKFFYLIHKWQMASDRGSDQVQATILDLSKAYDRSIDTWPTKRERSTHATCRSQTKGHILFPWTSFLPLFFRRVEGTKRNQEQRLYTQWSVKTRWSIVRVVWMCVNGVLVWTWVTDYSVSLCECVLCACLNSVRLATNDFCFHKTGFKTWMYIASRMFRWCFDRQCTSTLKSESSYVRQHSLFALGCWHVVGRNII